MRRQSGRTKTRGVPESFTARCRQPRDACFDGITSDVWISTMPIFIVMGAADGINLNAWHRYPMLSHARRVRAVRSPTAVQASLTGSWQAISKCSLPWANGRPIQASKAG